MAKPKDQETTAIEKNSYHAMGGHIGRHQDWSGGEGIKGKMWARTFIVVSMGRNWRGRVSSFRVEKF